jgi:hypothetical protein
VITSGVFRLPATGARAPTGFPGGGGSRGGVAGRTPTHVAAARCASCRTALPPFAHDGTERRIVRPQDTAEQTECYSSGKKKDHTVKNFPLVNARLIILFLSETVGGHVDDKRIADATPYPLPAGSRLLQDLGFVAFTLPEVEILMPMKKPRGRMLTLDQRQVNRSLHDRCLRI